MYIIILERATRAVNAVIARQAQAARVLLAAQNLQQCREQNNPYAPGNFLLGPSLSQRWGPDPCLTQEKELAEAQLLASQIAGAPTPAAPHAAVAPELSDSFDLNQNLDPSIPETEFITPDPCLNNMWSPDSIEQIMNEIWEEMEQQGGGSDQEMETLLQNITTLLLWVPKKGIKRNKKYQFHPNNQKWIGHWAPK
nr:MAG: nonstructural protein 2 [Protoparvovirus sp.]